MLEGCEDMYGCALTWTTVIRESEEQRSLGSILTAQWQRHRQTHETQMGRHRRGRVQGVLSDDPQWTSG